MPYEYGYELASCDICGSSLFLSGEGCSNCNGIARPISETEIARKAESAKIHAEKLKKAELLREEAERRNASSSQKYADFRELKDSVLLSYREKESYLSERQKSIINKKASAFRDSSKRVQDEIKSKIQQVHILNLMSYSDERANVLAFMLEEANRDLSELFTEAKAEFELLVGQRRYTAQKLALINRQQEDRVPRQKSVQMSQTYSTQSEKPLVKQILQEVKTDKVQIPAPVVPSVIETAPIYLYIEGERSVVEKAVQSARQKGLAPQYVLFSTSRPNAVWKASLRRECITDSDCKELINVGWV